MYRTDFWTLRERERVGWFGRMALKHVHYHVRNESPVSVWCRIQHAWGWCTGMTQRDGMAREVGGGFRIGNSCTRLVDSCQCMAKPIQYCKVKLKKKKSLSQLACVYEVWLLKVYSLSKLKLYLGTTAYFTECKFFVYPGWRKS